jgi:hypothetical protein
VLPAALLLLLGAVGLAGCASDKQKYCDAVKAHQAGLSKLVDAGGSDALLLALPTFEDLHDKAPDDIRDDWLTLIDALGDLRDALKAAHVDPSTYDRSHPPAGVTPAQQKAIDSAATELTNPATTQALTAVQQEARDVCQTPLYL